MTRTLADESHLMTTEKESTDMTPDELWRRYAALWPAPADRRASELDDCVHEACSYCDPNGLLEGPAALSAYMEGFRNAMPDTAFRIDSVATHHGRTSSTWVLVGAGDAVLQRGRSFATCDEQGRLQHITGFFEAPAQ